ncbi:MAG: hypothetical protein KBB91_00665 [Candidatus Pacebacteria bacterium]|nr:hypothetical protein [Candidatus Paceibacterota bacterium]
MKVLLMFLYCLTTTVAVGQTYETVLYANPFVSTRIKNKIDAGERSHAVISPSPKIQMYPLRTYRATTTALTIADALSQAVLQIRKHPLLLNGLNIVESNSTKVAVVRFTPRYGIFGKVVCRPHVYSWKKVIRLNKRIPVQIFIY